METEDVVTVGVVGLILYLLLRAKAKAKVKPFPPYDPMELVTSTIRYGEPMPDEMVD